MSELSSYVPIVALVSVIAAALTILYATRTRKRPVKEQAEPPVSPSVEEKPVSKEGDTSIPSIQVSKAKEDLQLLTLEKEIVAYALTRLYEAEAEGKITKDHRVQLLDKYRVEMKALEKQITRNETILKLHELEGTQADLIDTFNTRLNTINREIETLRVTLGLPPLQEITTKSKPRSKDPQTGTETAEDEPESEASVSTTEAEVEEPTPRRPLTKTETEQKLEAIQEEVLKALERLEQIETET